MKKNILLAFVAVFLISCESKTSNNTSQKDDSLTNVAKAADSLAKPDTVSTLQQNTTAPEVTEDTGNQIFTSVEVLPKFPGGEAAFGKFIQKYYKYPQAATEQGISGKVYTQFVVEKDGSLTDIKVVRDLGMGTGAEAVRVLKKMPKWEPGIQNGRPVRVAYTLPIALSTGEQ